MGTHNVAKIFGSHLFTYQSHICTEIGQCVSLLADASGVPDTHVNNDKKHRISRMITLMDKLHHPDHVGHNDSNDSVKSSGVYQHTLLNPELSFCIDFCT